MTRINTNVSSLTAQKSLSRSNVQLQEALTRLSTGLRINFGKDDPAGLIASEILRSDITSAQKAVANTQRASQIIATADSALGQASALLNDIRGLVTEAANEGALSDEQIAANQLQVDSSLDALNRIAQATNFQGRRLLDGSLDFIVSQGTGYSTVQDLQIEQANLGATGQVAVDVDVTAGATKALIDTAIPPVSGAGTAATAAVTLADGGAFTVTAPEVGTAYNDVDIQFVEDTTPAGAPTASYDAGQKVLTIHVNNAASTTTADIVQAIIDDTDFTATETNPGNWVPANDSPTSVAATAASATVSVADTGTLVITATATGVAWNTKAVNFVEDAGTPVGTPTAAYAANTLTITVHDDASTNLAAIANAINGTAEFSAVVTQAGFYNPIVDNPTTVAGVNQVQTVAVAKEGGGTTNLVLTAKQSGTSWNSAHINITEGAGATPTVTWDPNANAGEGSLNIRVNNAANTTLGAIIDAVNLVSASPYTASGTRADEYDYDAVAGAPPADANYNSTAGVNAETGRNAVTAGGAAAITGRNETTAGGVNIGGGLIADLVFQLSGANGTQVFSFQAGTLASAMAAAINLVSDATGVEATDNSNTLEFRSTAYGSDAFVGVNVISEGTGGAFASGLSATRALGTDVDAKVNGIAANGKGNTLSITTGTLSLTASVADGASTDFQFTITGGGALFQLGPDVVSNQQARLGIQSLDSATLGGASGRLYQLGSGGTAALATNTTTAARIVDEAITKVTSLRGRLGAFQRTTLDTNIKSLTDTIENLTGAESSIRDADFAAESAALTRAQILVQSGTSVLAIANQNPQNVLALLR